MKKIRGYMTSREFIRESSSTCPKFGYQNYCIQNNYQYLLSVVEYAMQNSYLILKQVTNDLKNIDGIGFYSIFSITIR